MKYRPIYIFGAIGVLVFAIVALSIADPTGASARPLAIIGPILLLGGIIAYQWRTWGTPPKVEPLPPGVSENDDPGRLSHWQMTQLLAVHPIGIEDLERAQRGQAGLIRANLKTVAVISLLPMATAVMLLTGKVPSFGDGEIFRLLPFILLPVAFLWVRYMLGRSAEAAVDTLSPLGLEMTNLPEVGVEPSFGGSGYSASVEGATVLEGERHGRPVRISLGDEHRTEIGIKLSEFEIGERSGRLTAGPTAPAEVLALIEALAPSEHWKGIKNVAASAEGVVVRRKANADNGWLWDLWLAERLAGASRA